jgi:uncharacterized membrane protein
MPGGAHEGNGGDMAGVLRRNIQALADVRQRFERQRTWPERVADAITRFAGRMTFVFLHMLIYGGWIAINARAIPGLRPFDPFPFVMLAMIASVEAIFLSTFILISQNRMTALTDRRADLDLQVNLLAEHEVTRLIDMVDTLSRRLVPPGAEQLPELERDVAPERLFEELEKGRGKEGG